MVYYQWHLDKAACIYCIILFFTFFLHLHIILHWILLWTECSVSGECARSIAFSGGNGIKSGNSDKDKVMWVILGKNIYVYLYGLLHWILPWTECSVLGECAGSIFFIGDIIRK